MAKIKANVSEKKVDDNSEEVCEVNFDILGAQIDDSFFENPQDPALKRLNIFTLKHRVSDVWRYTVKVCCGNIQIYPIVKSEEFWLSKFSDRSAIDAIGTKIILLVLESPHTSEYIQNPTGFSDLTPVAPAQGEGPGDAGGAFREYLHIVLRKINLPDGFYSLVISNPIPYLCSLGFFTNSLRKNNRNKIRDNVWEAIWNVKNIEGESVIKNEFIARCAMYQPQYIINCCTVKLSNFVTDEILKNNFYNLYKTSHPSVTWNTKQFGLPVNKV